MGIERLRWRSERQQARLLDALRRPLEQWHRDWCAGEPGHVLELASAAEGDGADWHWYGVDAKVGRVWIGMPSDAASLFGAALLGVAAPDRLGLAASVGRRAVRALVAAFGQCAAAEVADGVQPAGSTVSARSGAMHFLVKGGGVSLSLVLDGDMADHWLGHSESVSGSLDPRDKAVAFASVGARVELALGESRLDATRGLRVGDVLVSSTPLGAPFELRIGPSAALALGTLHRQQTTRAFVIEGAPSKNPP